MNLGVFPLLLALIGGASSTYPDYYDYYDFPNQCMGGHHQTVHQNVTALKAIHQPCTAMS